MMWLYDTKLLSMFLKYGAWDTPDVVQVDM